MLDTLEVTKDLLGIAVVLTSSPGHIHGERAEGIHDLRDCLDADVKQFADKVCIRGNNNLGPEARLAPTAI